MSSLSMLSLLLRGGLLRSGGVEPRPLLSGLTEDLRRLVFRSSSLAHSFEWRLYESSDEYEGSDIDELLLLFRLPLPKEGRVSPSLGRFGEAERDKLVEMVETDVDE
ncbi:hypothetical protein MMC34_005504 [Xylographa carneopallida]|nr:hypothetical protein [Xylographa carneopallida]